MTHGLSHGRTLLTDRFGIEQSSLPAFEQGRIDPRAWFDNPANPLEIEIGCGKGTFLVQQAAFKPNVNYLGIEWAAEFYRFSADRMRRRQLQNVRILHADATEFLRFWCHNGVADVIHLYFPIPGRFAITGAGSCRTTRSRNFTACCARRRSSSRHRSRGPLGVV